MFVIDQGIISLCVILFDCVGCVVGMVQCEFGQLFLQLGWVEYNFCEIFISVFIIIIEVMNNVQVLVVVIVGIGIIN